jgi:glucosylceramidase
VKNLGILTIVFIVAISSQTHGQLLFNPGFEDGTWTSESDLPDNWGKDQLNGRAAWKDSSQGVSAHSGNRCVLAGSDTDGGYGLWKQNVSAQPCTTYRCSVWAKTEGSGSSPNAALKINFRDIGGSLLATESIDIFTGSQPSPNNWTYYTFVTGSSPWGTDYIEFILWCDPYGSPMFDDASLTKLSAQPCPDFNNDQKVDIDDLAELADAWLDDINDAWYDEKYDLDSSDEISNGDLGTFSQYWLEDRTASVPVDAIITLDDTQTYQQIDGFGASLTDSSAWLFTYSMNTSQRQAALEELFDPATGIGLTYLRQPMGTSDFRVSSSMGGHNDYTYDDMPGNQTDYDLSEFSIAKDETYIIPVLQDILSISSDVQIMGSPWSPPHWMKNGNQLGSGTLKSDVYDEYALYFVKFIQAYDAHGINIDSITLQNEPHWEPTTYHGMWMDPADQIDLVLEMGPLFVANSIDTEIIVWDHNWDEPDYPISVLNNASAKSYIAGSAFHHYAGTVTAQSSVHSAHPNRDIHFTEGSNGSWQTPGFDSNFINTTQSMISIIRNWSKTFITWNLALDQNNGPKISGGCGTCYGVITINQYSGAVSRRPQYYTFGHSSKFVRPGAYRINSNDTSGQDIENVAFVNTDGSLVTIALNTDSLPQNVMLSWNGQSFQYLLPARSTATFKWDDQPSATVEVWLTTGDETKLLNQEPDVNFSY